MCKQLDVNTCSNICVQANTAAAADTAAFVRKQPCIVKVYIVRCLTRWLSHAWALHAYLAS